MQIPGWAVKIQITTELFPPMGAGADVMNGKRIRKEMAKIVRGIS
jgi:hypothetical protein